MINPKMNHKPAIGIGIAAIVAGLCLAALASDSARIEKPAAVDAEQYADFIENEVFNIQDLAEGAEIQRRRFNRMTPPGFSWVQPMFPSVVPFVAENFDEKFLGELLGEDKSSVAIYPLSLMQDPKTRETLVFNAEGKQIATIPADRVSREWPENADPARVTLLLDLLPAEDVEPFLYTESRIEESLSQREIAGRVTSGRAIARSLGAGEFGICGIRKTTNGTMLITVTNGLDAAEVYAYTVAHTSSVVVATWTNEYDEVITSTNVIWHPVSPPFDGIQSDWANRATNLVLTGGTGVWEDTNISSNARVRFYAVANRGDQDGDGLSDGAENLLHRTNLQSPDTDGDGLLDGYDISVQMGDPRYSLWANQDILYSESTGMRLFRGELSAGTNPLNDDTDGDGLPDGWEIQNDLDPLSATGDDGPEGDPDGDGFDNALEFALGAPANNSAWNGNELAYRLTHAHAVIVTNTKSITTNLIGMRVEIEDSWDCVAGGNAGVQNKVDTLDVGPLLECGYYINITVEGSVENVDTNYDKVSFEAFTNTPYFSSHNTDKWPEECDMIGEVATRNILIMGNSTVYLRYNTAGYKWHSGAYAEIMEATNTGPYKVVITGDDATCVGETVSLSASGAAGPPYTWSTVGGNASVTTNGEVTGVSPGYATITATDANGCSAEKEIAVIQVEIDLADTQGCDGEQVDVDLVVTPSNAVSYISGVQFTAEEPFGSGQFDNPSGQGISVVPRSSDITEWQIPNVRWYSTQTSQCNDYSDYEIMATYNVGGSQCQTDPVMFLAFAGECTSGSADIFQYFSGDIDITTTQVSPTNWEATVTQGTFRRDVQALYLVNCPTNSQFYNMVLAEELYHRDMQFENPNHPILSAYWLPSTIIANVTALEPYTGATEQATISAASNSFEFYRNAEIVRSRIEALTPPTHPGAVPGDVRCALETEAKTAAGASHRMKMECSYIHCQ